MKKDLDLNDIARFEKAIAKKYGNEAIENPRKHWNDEKEAKDSHLEAEGDEKTLEELKATFNTLKEEKSVGSPAGDQKRRKTKWPQLWKL